MNNSEKKDLIRRKGFDPVARGNDISIRVDDRVILLTASNIEWLQSLNDVIEPEYKFEDVIEGDRVQMFSPIHDFKWWGRTGVVLAVRHNTEFGSIAAIRCDDFDESIILHFNSITVIDRIEEVAEVIVGIPSQEERTKRVRDLLEGKGPKLLAFAASALVAAYMMF